MWFVRLRLLIFQLSQCIHAPPSRRLVQCNRLLKRIRRTSAAVTAPIMFVNLHLRVCCVPARESKAQNGVTIPTWIAQLKNGDLSFDSVEVGLQRGGHQFSNTLLVTRD